MKKLISLLIVAVLLVGCFTGCGNSKPAETESNKAEEAASKAETEAAATEKESAAEDETVATETTAPQVELNTVTVLSEEGDKKVEITYNDTFCDCTYEEGYAAYYYVTDALSNAIWDEEDGLFEEYTDIPKTMCGGGEFRVYSNYTKDDFYWDRRELLTQCDMHTSELTKITISGKEAYMFEEDDDGTSMLITNVMFEIDDCMLLFTFNNIGLVDETGTILDVEAFLVDAKVVE